MLLKQTLLFFRCDSPEKLKALLPRLEQELKDSGKFKDFYQFTFNFAKNPGQKGLGEQNDHSDSYLLGDVTDSQSLTEVFVSFLSVCRLGDGCGLLEPGSVRAI